MNPFLVLNVPLEATDAQVRAAWQAGVQKYSPESDPDRFQAIQEAWQQLKDERARWKARTLLPVSDGAGPLDALVNFARLPGRFSPPGLPAFRSWLQACLAAETDTPVHQQRPTAQKKKSKRRKKR